MKLKFFFTTISFAFLFTTCIKDKQLKTYTIYRPEYSVKQEVKDNAKLQKPEPLKDPGSFALYENTMYINEKNKGIHVIDYSNPGSPVNKGFIPIPGNIGLAIRANILYADCYMDLFMFKIHSPENIQFQNALPNTFFSRVGYQNHDTNCVKLTWIKKDTTVTQDYYNGQYNNYDKGVILTNAQSPANVSASGGSSVGSSLAIFAIVNDYLYTVDRSNLSAFSLKDASTPTLENCQHVNWDVETIFPFKDKLFIGSMTGMYIYSISNPAVPSKVGTFNHVRVCDPVIADDLFAFVTLRNGSRCGGFINQLDVLNIENITNPVLIKSFPFSNPRGLSKDGKVLFVCDGSTGLRIVDASDVNNLVIKQTLPIGNAIDVVASGQKAFVMLETAIQIYSYDQQFNVQLLGSITRN